MSGNETVAGAAVGYLVGQNENNARELHNLKMQQNSSSVSAGSAAGAAEYTRLLNEAQESAKAWQERAIKAETSRDSWKEILSEFIYDDNYPDIIKEQVNEKYHDLYDNNVVKNLKSKGAFKNIISQDRKSPKKEGFFSRLIASLK